MCETGIGVEDCQALKLILSSFTSLMVLDISGNDLPHVMISTIGVEDCQALKLILSSFTSLMVLDISGNDLPHVMISTNPQDH